jgi:hypothetical protein
MYRFVTDLWGSDRCVCCDFVCGLLKAWDQRIDGFNRRSFYLFYKRLLALYLWVLRYHVLRGVKLSVVSCLVLYVNILTTLRAILEHLSRTSNLL